MSNQNEDPGANRIPMIYFNGYEVAMSHSDIQIQLTVNGHPNAILNTSWTTAKTLAMGLNHIITRLEEIADRKIITTKEMDEAIKQAAPPAESSME